MIILGILVLLIMLLTGIISIAVRFVWSVTKFVFGLGLFWFCPLLFVLAVAFGWLGGLWLPILIIGLLFGGGFRRAGL